MKDCEYFKFTIATVERKEKIKLSKEAVTLKPQISPGTQITIPENTFDDDSNLSIKVFIICCISKSDSILQLVVLFCLLTTRWKNNKGINELTMKH